MFIREPEREIIVLDQVDVLVAGAGVAGCAAAIAAARTGAKTMLLERSGALGGVATCSWTSRDAR
jgi:flavin-dependent dehydrogenase